MTGGWSNEAVLNDFACLKRITLEIYSLFMSKQLRTLCHPVALLASAATHGDECTAGFVPSPKQHLEDGTWNDGGSSIRPLRTGNPKPSDPHRVDRCYRLTIIIVVVECEM